MVQRTLSELAERLQQGLEGQYKHHELYHNTQEDLLSNVINIRCTP